MIMLLTGGFDSFVSFHGWLGQGPGRCPHGSAWSRRQRRESWRHIHCRQQYADSGRWRALQVILRHCDGCGVAGHIAVPGSPDNLSD